MTGATHQTGAAADTRWFAVHTKPRQEHIAEEHLARQGFECYLPRAFNPQRKMRSERPRVEALFPRYLFLRANTAEQNIAPVKYTRGVARMVKFGQKLAEVPDWVVDGLQGASDDAGLVQLNVAPVSEGQEVEVFSGPLAGLRGVVQHLDGEQRALLLLDLLGRHNTITVPASCLRPKR